MNWYLKVLKQYADFSGRARRKEFWMFLLFYMIVFFLLGLTLAIIEEILSLSGETALTITNIATGLYAFAMIIPWLAVSVRRLHDIGKSGWMFLIVFIPIIGRIWLLILMLTHGDICDNKYGPDPKDIID